MADLAKWPELERLDNPLDPEGVAFAPVEIRFQVQPKPGEEWDFELAAECSVEDRPAPSPGAVTTFKEWETDATPTFYCYALSRNLREGDRVRLRVRPREERVLEKTGLLWEKDFRVRRDGDKLRLE